ncbi:hypothetical protein Hanom_Chr06g00520521 [Helianthus anomalus]
MEVVLKEVVFLLSTVEARERFILFFYDMHSYHSFWSMTNYLISYAGLNVLCSQENQCICTVWEGDGCTQVSYSNLLIDLFRICYNWLCSFTAYGAMAHAGQVRPSDVIVMLGPKMQLQRSKYIYPFLILLYFLLCHYVSSLIRLGFCNRVVKFGL